MLSDACGDFLTTLIEGETNHKEAIKRLCKEVQRYGGWYGSQETSDLLAACAAALFAPAGANSSRAQWLGPLVKLVVLAEQVRAYHGTPTPRISDAWIRAMDDVRCLDFECAKDRLLAPIMCLAFRDA